MFFGNKKKGLSKALDVILILTISLVILGVIWVIVRDFVLSDSEQLSLQKLIMDLRIERVKVLPDNTISVTVMRNEGDGDFIGLKFIIEDEKNSEEFVEYVSLNQYEIRNFNFTLDKVSSQNITNIKIAPIFLLTSGKEEIGSFKTVWEKNPSGIYECVPDCDGKVCGDDGCGGSCGKCSIGSFCTNGTCICLPKCTGRECGSNGCPGGTCGECINEHGTNLCVAGTCQPTCISSYGDCDGNRTNGCEATLGTDIHCSSCGDACSPGYFCSSSKVCILL
ncbi:MAG TPA: hypothetical protein PK357_02585 [Candidatus Pacearchaeota archaeon]|nr:hypothetical protein [Candidatus Pacearchaeota archaeon]